MPVLTYFAVILCCLVIHYQCAPASLTQGEQDRESIDDQWIDIDHSVSVVLAKLYQGDIVLQPSDDDPRGVSLQSVCNTERNISFKERRCSSSCLSKMGRWCYSL